MNDRPKPSAPKLGDVVHYKDIDSLYSGPTPIRAAIVTQVSEPYTGSVGLFVLHPTHSIFIPSVPYSASSSFMCWHWPDDSEIVKNVSTAGNV